MAELAAIHTIRHCPIRLRSVGAFHQPRASRSAATKPPQIAPSAWEPLSQPATQLGDSLRLRQFASEARDFCGRPVGVRDRSHDVAARWRMLLYKFSEVSTWNPVGKTNQRWPEPSVNEGNLAADNAANKNIIIISNGACPCINLSAFWVGPPTSLNRPLCHFLC